MPGYTLVIMSLEFEDAREKRWIHQRRGIYLIKTVESSGKVIATLLEKNHDKKRWCQYQPVAGKYR